MVMNKQCFNKTFTRFLTTENQNRSFLHFHELLASIHCLGTILVSSALSDNIERNKRKSSAKNIAITLHRKAQWIVKVAFSRRFEWVVAHG